MFETDIFLSLCSYLGIPIAREKTFGPLTTLSFAGIELDSIQMDARLPSDKLSKCIELIEAFLKRKKVTLRELQSLIGLLNFACSVVRPGRAFLRRLIDLTIGIHSGHFMIRLSKKIAGLRPNALAQSNIEDSVSYQNLVQYLHSYQALEILT